MVSLIKQLTAERAKKIEWLLTDVDDTLTWRGRIPPETLTALERLHRAGVKVVAVTGACAGWCDHIAKLWPLYGVIGENGAFWMIKNRHGFQTHYTQPVETMRERQEQLREKIRTILADYPDVDFAADQGYRICDVAINLSQDRIPVNKTIAQDIARQIGDLSIDGDPVNVMLSSIHINAWVGEHSKQRSGKSFLRSITQQDEIDLATVTYIGDSHNDESMFAWLPLTFGVNNILAVMDDLTHQPSFITERNGGYGFSELADNLLQLRGT
ncbi:HAD-IIB family hydrolase [Vibrio spartinae]|uniref:Phosphoglycolate phosphatase n=1 Tax=Vibrio spartinae TaxID=1918945 RepID=A0A1N6LZL3_9VIBR|nr:HAD-IIB family hydrolase [Vibrio spartinae]SIO92600.1 phosphoglycolate phosphatase [Vibrio spartinae]